MFKVTFAAALIATLASTALAVPTVEMRASELSPNVSVCTGSSTEGCVNVPIGSDACIDFTGGLSFLNKEVTTVTVPDGFVCTFFAQGGCLSNQGGADTIVALGGTTNMFEANGPAGTVDFNDQASSFSCSPV